MRFCARKKGELGERLGGGGTGGEEGNALLNIISLTSPLFRVGNAYISRSLMRLAHLFFFSK